MLMRDRNQHNIVIILQLKIFLMQKLKNKQTNKKSETRQKIRQADWL